MPPMAASLPCEQSHEHNARSASLPREQSLRPAPRAGRDRFSWQRSCLRKSWVGPCACFFHAHIHFVIPRRAQRDRGNQVNKAAPQSGAHIT
jgi:hypothetical protein